MMLWAWLDKTSHLWNIKEDGHWGDWDDVAEHTSSMNWIDQYQLTPHQLKLFSEKEKDDSLIHPFKFLTVILNSTKFVLSCKRYHDQLYKSNCMGADNSFYK